MAVRQIQLLLHIRSSYVRKLQKKKNVESNLSEPLISNTAQKRMKDMSVFESGKEQFTIIA